MAEDSLDTRVTLVERSMVTREQLVEKEERLLQRFEDLLKRDRAQASEERKHEFKMYGHETAEQLRVWSAKIHADRDEILARRDAERIRDEESRVNSAPIASPIKGWFYKNWIWVGGTAVLVIILRPDLATAVVRAVM
jgi:hypothetical protein